MQRQTALSIFPKRDARSDKKDIAIAGFPNWLAILSRFKDRNLF